MKILSFEEILAQISGLVEKEELTLPTLPEIALRIQRTVENPNVTMNQLSEVISLDAVLSAKLIKMANSPFMRRGVPIESLHMAINRMGLNYVRNLAVGLAMEHIFQATDATIDKLIRECWEHSTRVAGYSYVLATNYTHLASDMALLAGLLHNIGALPILTYAEENEDIFLEPEELQELVDTIHPRLGSRILVTWNFPPDIAAVPLEHLQFGRKVDKVDMVDVVTVAVLEATRDSEHVLANVNRNKVGAYKRFGLDPDVPLMEVEALRSDLEAATAMFAN